MHAREAWAALQDAGATTMEAAKKACDGVLGEDLWLLTIAERAAARLKPRAGG